MASSRPATDGSAIPGILTPRGEISVRPERSDGSDAGFLFGLFAAVRGADLAPIAPEMRETLLRLQFRSMTATFAQEFPDARYEIIELDGTPIGRVVIDVAPICVTYVDIAVLPSRQGGGIATDAMQALLAEPSRLGLPARLKVMATNTASLRLCARLGFSRRAEVFPFVLLERG